MRHRCSGEDASGPRGRTASIAATRAREGAPFAGGLAFHTPFGTVYFSNITLTGPEHRASWPLERGEFSFGRCGRASAAGTCEHLYPVFPYPPLLSPRSATRTSSALYAFLQVAMPRAQLCSACQRHDIPLRRARRLLGVWKAMFFKEGRLPPRIRPSPPGGTAARISSKVSGIAATAIRRAETLWAGRRPVCSWATGVSVLQESLDDRPIDWSAVNLTSGANGLQAWPLQDLTNYLKLGYRSPRQRARADDQRGT